ncbi:MAG: putative tellurium resistance protein TerD [Alphaproteobacteria bacterium]|nr:putative tellurium resistance protein TerD [Alphaproteobacteria bacterium]
MPAIFKKNDDKSLKELGVSSPMLVFAINWDNKKKKGLLNALTGKKYEADLDLSCVVYDKNNDRIDCIWYAELSSKDGAIRHKGDDTVGWHEGDDEAVIVDLNQLTEEARTLFFVISSFSGDSFTHVEITYWHLFDGQSKQEIGRYEISPRDKSKAKIVMRLQKEEANGLSEWRIKALDEPATGQNIQEIFPEIRSLIEG